MLGGDYPLKLNIPSHALDTDHFYIIAESDAFSKCIPVELV
jgi:hypothetical protein